MVWTIFDWPTSIYIYPTTLKIALFNSSLRLLHLWTIWDNIWRSVPEISVNISVNASTLSSESCSYWGFSTWRFGFDSATSTKVAETLLGSFPFRNAGFKRLSFKDLHYEATWYTNIIFYPIGTTNKKANNSSFILSFTPIMTRPINFD